MFFLSIMLTSQMWEDSNLEEGLETYIKIEHTSTQKILEYKGNSSDHILVDNIIQIKFP